MKRAEDAKTKAAAQEERKQKVVDDDARRRGVKGNGWLEKRGKFWSACWKFNGQLFKRTTKETVEAKAREKLAQFTAPYRTAHDDCRNVAASQLLQSGEEHARREMAHQPTLALADVYETFLKLPGATRLAKGTLALRERAVETFARFMQSRRRADRVEMRTVGYADARAFMDELKKRGTSMQSCAVYVSHLKKTWQAIEEEEKKIKNDPAQSAKLTSWVMADLAQNPWALIFPDYTNKAVNATTGVQRVKRTPFTLDEMRRLFAAAKGEMLTLFQIGAHTGLRLGDAATLTWDEIDLDWGETGKLKRKPTKTKHSSGVVVEQALGRELHDALAAIPTAIGRTGYLTPELAEIYNGGDGPARLSKRVQNFIRSTGIKTGEKPNAGAHVHARCTKGFHSLRYSYVSIRANRGDELDAIRAAVGHTSTGMTEQYRVKDEATLEREAEIVSDFFSTSRNAPTTAQKREKALARENTRDDVPEAQVAVYDAVCAMLGNLQPATLRAVASEAIRLAMKQDRKTPAAAVAVA